MQKGTINAQAKCYMCAAEDKTMYIMLTPGLSDKVFECLQTLSKKFPTEVGNKVLEQCDGNLKNVVTHCKDNYIHEWMEFLINTCNKLSQVAETQEAKWNARCNTRSVQLFKFCVERDLKQMDLPKSGL